MAQFGPLLRRKLIAPRSLHMFSFSQLDWYREIRNEVGCLSPVQRPLGFEVATFWFRCNGLTHWPILPKHTSYRSFSASAHYSPKTYELMIFRCVIPNLLEMTTSVRCYYKCFSRCEKYIAFYSLLPKQGWKLNTRYRIFPTRKWKSLAVWTLKFWKCPAES